MRAPSRLPAMRARAESRMTSTIVVRRPDPANPVTDEHGYRQPGWTDVYDGPFRLAGAKASGSGSRTVTVGGVEVTVAVRTAHFPAGTTGLADDDLCEVTGGENAGVVLRIVEASSQDQATALRVPVIEAQRPTSWS